ncbi:uncharacterized protein LOC143452855 [Clavelina lepadiformis]|uniref:uncharacterized protein LOC143452855 n=1 Tax=Clavelina lepadiformis TaxID=159417 RepID=UPI00404368A5
MPDQNLLFRQRFQELALLFGPEGYRKENKVEVSKNNIANSNVFGNCGDITIITNANSKIGPNSKIDNGIILRCCFLGKNERIRFKVKFTNGTEKSWAIGAKDANVMEAEVTDVSCDVTVVLAVFFEDGKRDLTFITPSSEESVTFLGPTQSLDVTYDGRKFHVTDQFEKVEFTATDGTKFKISSDFSPHKLFGDKLEITRLSKKEMIGTIDKEKDERFSKIHRFEGMEMNFARR